MKAVILTTIFIAKSYAFASTSCVLADTALSKSPAVSIEINDANKTANLYFYKSTKLSEQIWAKVVAKNDSEDLLSVYKNFDKEISINWSTDVTDKNVMGMTEGTIKSPYMNGKIMCAEVED